MSDLRKAIERAALAFDEFVGMAMGVAIVKAESVRSRAVSEDFLLQLLLIRRYAIGVLEQAGHPNVGRLIHMPAMPEYGMLDFEEEAKSLSEDSKGASRLKLAEPGQSPDAQEFPSESCASGLESWQQLGELVKQP